MPSMTQGNAHRLVLLGFKMEFSGFPDGFLKPKSGKSESFSWFGMDEISTISCLSGPSQAAQLDPFLIYSRIRKYCPHPAGRPTLVEMLDLKKRV